MNNELIVMMLIIIVFVVIPYIANFFFNIFFGKKVDREFEEMKKSWKTNG